MGRILGTLGRNDGWSARGRSVAPPPPADSGEFGGEVPFIEVGGPSPARETQRPAARPAPAARPPGPGLFTILFQPLPAESLPAVTADARLSADLVSFHDPDHPVAAQYRSLAQEIAEQLDRPARVVSFTGSGPAAGTTTVVLNLAVGIARHGGVRVLVVDARTTRPAVADWLAVAAVPGLRDVLARTTPSSWAVQTTAQPGLSVMTAGRGGVGLDGVAAVLDGLRSRFDWVLVDGPPWGDGPEAGRLAAACDASYLVMRQSAIDAPELQGLRDEVRKAGGRLRGYVLTHG